MAGYKGKVCDTDINECEGNPCKNGGTCKNFVGNFSCDCLLGYGGNVCELDRCAMNNSCLNGAKCSVQSGEIICTCPPTYTGIDCGKGNKMHNTFSQLLSKYICSLDII